MSDPSGQITTFDAPPDGERFKKGQKFHVKVEALVSTLAAPVKFILQVNYEESGDAVSQTLNPGDPPTSMGPLERDFTVGDHLPGDKFALTATLYQGKIDPELILDRKSRLYHIVAGEAGEAQASCFYQGQEYSDGSLVCQAGRLMRCNDGVWQDTGDACPPLKAPKDPDEGFIVTHTRTIPMRVVQQVADISSTFGADRLPCISFQANPAPPLDSFLIVNQCDKCKVAQVLWIPYSGKPYIKEYRVEAKSAIVVKSEAYQSRLLGEQDCK
jgi:Protein of unknown function (DUF1496)